MNRTEPGKKPLTRIQKLIGRRMVESKLTKPHFYMETTANVTELMKLRPRLKKTLGVKVTTNSFYLKALALAATQLPLTVATLTGEKIRIADHINIGFAVNAPQGLLVPVIRDVDRKSLADLARIEKDFTARARSNELTLEEMEGETLALSNLGAYGIDSFFGIIPPPATTILAVGYVNRSAVALDGRMIDKPVADRARLLLARAGRWV